MVPMKSQFCRLLACQGRRLQHTVAVCMSGGIDSSVTAMMLQSQGYKCVGVFMKNWDNSDELGAESCSVLKDYEDMKQVCEQLKMETVQVGSYFS